MELLEVLESYNPHWFGEKKKEGIKREKYLNILENERKKRHITFLVGLRRVGKTTILKQFINFLIERGEKETRILYLSLDHPMLERYPLDEIIREVRKRNEISKREKLYLFLDEVLYYPNIFQWLKVLHDNENVKLYATSSSSLKLKDEKAFLAGRYRLIKVKPLSFKEYLIFRGRKGKEPHLLERYFEEYLRDGGIPYYVLTGDVSYLVALAEDIIMKDISSRLKVANPMKLKELFLLLLSRVGKPTTYRKLAKLLSLKEETVENYISKLSSSELVHLVYRFSKSLNERIYSPKKVYLGDVGFRYAFTGKYSIGSNLENVLLLEILEEEPFYYLEGGVEIDFITSKKNVYECKIGRKLTEKQKALLNNLKRKGYSIHIVDSYRYFLK